MSSSIDILRRILNDPVINDSASALKTSFQEIPQIVVSENEEKVPLANDVANEKKDSELYKDNLSEPPLSSSSSISSLEIGLTDLDEFEKQFLDKIHRTDSVLIQDFEIFISTQEKDFKRIERKIQNSQRIIENIDSEILKFSNKLQELSKQMNSLDFKSREINENLDTYKDLKHELLPIVNDLVINPKVINSIINDKIDSSWCENLTYLDLKSQFLRKYNYLQDYKFIKEIQNLHELLTLKSIDRIKHYLIHKIKMIRFKEVSLQAIQFQLLQIAQAFRFIQIYKPQLVKDFQNAYILTVKWYYYKNFGKYLYSLEKLKYHKIDENFLLGNNIDGQSNKSSLSYSGSKLLSTGSSWLRSFNSTIPAGNQSNFAASSSSSSANFNTHIFESNSPQSCISLNEYLNSTDSRLKTLFDDETCLPAQIAETNPLNFWIEFGFKNLNLCIVDNCKVEYYFLEHFLYQQQKNNNDMNDDTENNNNEDQMEESAKHNFLKTSFQEIFGKVFNLGSNYTKFYLINPSNHDYISILLSIKLCDLLLLRSLNLPSCLNNYLQFAKLQLWPVFQNLIELNCKNLHQKFMINAFVSTAVLTPSSESSRETQELLQNPRPVTIQFAEVLSSLLKIASINFEKQAENLKNDNTHENNDPIDVKLIEEFFQSEHLQDPLSTSIPKLRNDFETILNKISKHIGSNSSSKKQPMPDKRRELFFYVNYNYIYDSLQNLPKSEMVQLEQQHFKLLVDAYKEAL